MATEFDIELIRGDTPVKAYKLFDDALDPLDLSGVTVWLTVKPAVDDADATDATAVIKHYMVVDGSGAVSSAVGFAIGGIDPEEGSPTYGTTVSGAASGVFTHTMPQADSNALLPGDYVYDLQVKSAAGRYKTVIYNAAFVVKGDITRRITTP